jgi:BirA family biotin operon repressor/biotin-[acetyl-CoA-carboxylase] ligase
MSGFSLAIGVAAAEALRASGYPQVRVKWPNDLVCALGKLGGILVELREPSARGCTLLVGIGLNLRLPAESAIDQPACDLTRLRAAPPARLPIAAALLDRLLPALAEFERAGWPAFAPRWTAFDALAGREVQVLDGGRGLDGRVLGVDADGALRLAAADGEHRVLAGEVSLRLHEAAHG